VNTTRNLTFAIALALTVGSAWPVQTLAQDRAPAISAAEVEALKTQLALLQERLAALEAAQQGQAQQVAAATQAAAEQVAANAEQQEAIDRTTDALAQTRAGIGDWVGRFEWRGDLRYRNETIDQEFALATRHRDRIRARVGFIAKVNDTVRVEVRATTTEGFDARSANQTLSNANARKALDLDLGYVEWNPGAGWRLTAGKMRFPWVRSTGYLWDNDVNPEGIAANWQQGSTGFFGGIYYLHLGERSTQADSNVLAAQAGWRGDVADGWRATLSASYFDHGAVEGYNAFFDGNAANAYGNTVVSSPALCRRGITTCLANDYNVVYAAGEVVTQVAERPLLLFADVARNTAADYRSPSSNPAANAPGGLDTAYVVGFNYGRASAPGSWEVGYMWQKVEKDAVYGQWLDSNFGAGNTDNEGGTLRIAYMFGRNWRLNATYIMSETNVGVPVQVTVPTTRIVSNREYQRLMLDLNMIF
jgi:hypothetical protein